jgi:hypothetical protein
MATNNRRRHARVKPKQLTARIRAGEQLHIGLGIENVSMGGAFVRCNSVLPVGQKVKLEIQRPGAIQLLTFSATVMSSLSVAQAAQQKRVPGVGLKFDAMPPHLEAWLAEVVANSPGASSGSAEPPQAPPILAPTARSAPRAPPPAFPGSTPPPRFPPSKAPAAAPPPRLSAAAPDASWDQQGTQAAIPAFVPARELDASKLLDEVNALKELLGQREKLIAELKRENADLRQALAKRLSEKR